MAITGVGNYSSVYENTYALSRKETAKKEETEAKGGKAESLKARLFVTGWRKRARMCQKRERRGLFQQRT